MYVQDQVGAGFSNWLVIDGQPLLTTLTLLMVALRDNLADVGWAGNVPSVAQIDDFFLKNNFETGVRGYRVGLRRICLAVAALVVSAVLSGCGGASPAEVTPARPTAAPVPETATKTAPPPPTEPTELRSGKVPSAPTVGAADLAELVRRNNAFAFDLYHALSGRDGNLFYSPFSVSQALAMTYLAPEARQSSRWWTRFTTGFRSVAFILH